MSRFEGILRYVDIGPGAWVLEVGGDKMPLYGEVDRSLDGKRVAVTGQAVAQMGFAMTGRGKAIQVEHIRAL